MRNCCGFPVRGSGSASSATDPHQSGVECRSWARGAAVKACLKKCKNVGQAEGVKNSTGNDKMREREMLQAPE